MACIQKIWSFLAFVSVCQAYRVLVVSPIPSGSHVILGDACVHTLLDAGHEVTYITTRPKNRTRPGLTEIDLSANAKYYPMNLINLTTYLNGASHGTDPIYFFHKSSVYTEELIKHPAVQEVMINGHFDVIIAEWMFSEMYSGFSAVFNCPFIWFSSMQPHSLLLRLIDDIPNPSYSSDFLSTLPTNFIERALELVIRNVIIAYREFLVYTSERHNFERLFAPHMARVGRELPSYEELRYNASVILSNSHLTLGQVMHLPPNYISLGGYHVNPEAEVLSEDLKRIMDNAKNGVIYFSMGSILQSKDFPQQMKSDLLKMFSSIKQTVIWKYEEELPNSPSNVHVLKWASQQGILAHPNCVLFITHGGLLSLVETIHYGIPIVGVPVFADQFVNIGNAESKGYAVQIKLSNHLAKDLKVAINEVLKSPRYKEKAMELSFVYHHRPVSPRAELIHWVDHVVQTRGAPYSRSPALQVHFYQKQYLDFIAVVIVVIIALWRCIKCAVSGISRRLATRKFGEKKNE